MKGLIYLLFNFIRFRQLAFGPDPARKHTKQGTPNYQYGNCAIQYPDYQCPFSIDLLPLLDASQYL